MPKNNSAKKALSLIETAVAVVVISILMIAILGGKYLITKSKISSARSLTFSSPVRDIGDLVLWLETSSIDSFDSVEVVNNGQISTWKDINPNATSPRNATQSIASRRPTYVEKGFNNLPTLKFDGVDDFLNLPDGTFPYGSSSYHIFLVAKFPGGDGSQIAAAYGSGNCSSGSIALCNTMLYSGLWQGKDRFTNMWFGSGDPEFSGGTSNRFNTFSFSYDKDTSSRKFHVNGSIGAIYANGDYGNALTSYTSSRSGSLPCCNYVGKVDSTSTYNTLNGEIAEIIVFNKALSDKDREDVELYLKKKWRF